MSNNRRTFLLLSFLAFVSLAVVLHVHSISRYAHAYTPNISKKHMDNQREQIMEYYGKRNTTQIGNYKRLLTHTTRTHTGVDFIRSKQATKVENSSNYLNRSSFNVLSQPESCYHGKDLFMIVYIHSNAKHFSNRMLIRSTWGDSNNYKWMNRSIKTIFVLGLPGNHTIDNSVLLPILQENIKYKDILLANFNDRYNNLTEKALNGMKYVIEQCPLAKFVLKVDDDVFVNMFKLIEYITSNEEMFSKSRHLMCHVWKDAKVVRKEGTKWYMPYSVYTAETFPDYCSGSAVIATTEVLRQLYEESRFVPHINIDDVYITGILRQRLDIPIRSLNNYYSLFGESLKSRACVTYMFIHDLKSAHYIKLWKWISNKSQNKGPGGGRSPREELCENILT